MAIWGEDGLIESRANALIQAFLGSIPMSKVEPLDEGDRKFLKSLEKQAEEMRAEGIKNFYFSIPQM